MRRQPSLRKLAISLISAASLLSVSTAFAEVGYYSAPSANDQDLVFASEGDLWMAATDGGLAARLTTHPEIETNPVFSLDGEFIAFNARYDGSSEIYVMPRFGGTPKQITFEGGGVTMRGWTDDGDILFTSTNVPGTRYRVLRTANPETGRVKTLPFNNVNDMTQSDNGQYQFFTRHGLSRNNDNAVLYRGGGMAQLWRAKRGDNKDAIRLAVNFGAPIRFPMWYEGRIYFTTDKSGSDNIWSFDKDGADARQHTKFEGLQLRGPRLSDGKIYYQKGADLFYYNLEAEIETAIELELVSDRDFTRQRWLDEPLRYLNNTGMSANGKSVAITARGQVAIGFTGDRRRVELPIPKDARARSAIVGNAGKWVYLVQDQDSYGEIWRYPSDGLGAAEQLTKNNDSHIWSISLSPNGKRLVYGDKKRRLWALDIKSGRRALLETSVSGSDSPFSNFNWSNGGRYVAYTATDKAEISYITIRDFKTGTSQRVTSRKYDAYSPAFSKDNKWLYFISDRNFNPSPSGPWGDRNLGPAFDKRGRIYALQLDKDAHFAFAAKNELSGVKPPAKKNSNDIDIDFGDLNDRLWQVPVRAGNYNNLSANNSFIFATERGADSTNLKAISIRSKNIKVTNFASRIRNYDLSKDGKTIFYRSGFGNRTQLALVPAGATAPKNLNSYAVRLRDWRLAVHPKQEWKQLFLDAWRLQRDFTFDANLRGGDWEAIREKYLPMVERIGHRSELNNILGQMIAERGILHSQIRRGDQPSDEESGEFASLGAEFTSVRNGLRVTQIYKAETDLIEQRGPLLKPGIDVEKGDVLRAVNGRPVTSVAELYAALSHQAGQEVRLDFSQGKRRHSVIVTPVNGRAAAALRYRHWVQSNRERVTKMSDNKIGYLHLRAMGSADLASFTRDFYHHLDKDGIIIDVRGNNGGNIDSVILTTLLRRPWMFWQSQLGEGLGLNMQQAFRGHLTVLIDEGTYSDGETFAAGFKALELGPLIGTRTAGAGLWISDRNRLADGGQARSAEYPQFSLDGRWLIEGRGVSPDIEVVNPPRASFAGGDAQLAAGIKYLTETAKSNPIPTLRPESLPPLGGYGDDIK